jgi:hypothetical protein
LKKKRKKKKKKSEMTFLRLAGQWGERAQ